jgi:transposase
MVTKGMRYTEEFKRDAAQSKDRGYSVKEVPETGWALEQNRFTTVSSNTVNPKAYTLKKTKKAQENRGLKAELARVTKERDIFKKATAFFARETK